MPDTTLPVALPPHVALLLSELPLPRPTTIVDVGANPITDNPYKPLLDGGGCHVIGFEPQTDAFAELQRIKGPNETYHPHAVGDGQTHALHIYRSSGFTSLFRPHMPAARVYGGARWAKITETVDLPTVALDALPDLAPFDMLKIDIQGGEKLVIDNARRVLTEAVAVIIELRYLQLYENEPMMGGVDETLRGQGFMLHKFLFNKSRPMPNSQADRLNRRRIADQLVDGDAVYLRHPGRIDSYTDAQVMHLAILCAGVFHSQSTALYALDELVRRKRVEPDLPARYVDALPELYRKAPATAAGQGPAAQATPEPAAQPKPAAKAKATRTSASKPKSAR
ncbi:FkbM family methyltransferase [Rhodobacteraceae bacterium HSP-20]|uniref:FkbM family methyltransferase n=1 Tax=Paragemmobacter amnigenus TaxID=2852097 RepID=A0ABS6J926_9RHOB|nr:FkbM family methyltransferase [Rhodobacter amnigenus]MBU9699389.1 FkbM family methyltransferase [Rhodobacter amnigenus]MBV4390616.1 FkbM family methyltransferase [Rhodobacter amnigenus]